MSPARLPRLGSVAWAKLEDANGFGKVRPVVVVSPTAEIATGKPVRVVAITTRLPATLPDDHVLLPWDPTGKARSGLRRRCAAVASWQAQVPVGRIARQSLGKLRRHIGQGNTSRCQRVVAGDLGFRHLACDINRLSRGGGCPA